MYKFCVFDMDGTVVNSIGDISAAMNRSLEKMGYKTYTEKEYCYLVGNGMEILCRRAIPDADEQTVQKLISLYKNDYLNNCCTNTVIYDGVEEAIKKLNANGIKCAIISNKPHPQAMEVADKLFSEDMFVEVMGQKPEFPIKPDPASLLFMINKYGYDLSEVAFIGDTSVDMELGNNAGVFPIGVTWGFRDRKELEEANAGAVVDTAEELVETIMKKAR